MRERVPGVDGQRGGHGQRGFPEVRRREGLLIRAQLLGSEELDALCGEQGLELIEKAAVCSSLSWRLRAATAARAAAGASPSGPGRSSPARCRRRRSATRTMKNSSRFELTMARNLTRSRRGTEGSSASSRTRWLNASHDSSRLTKRSLMERRAYVGLATIR